jgi:hypothetical protein
MASSQVTLKPFDSPSQKIKIALTELACFRQAKVEAGTLIIFAKRLVSENLSDVLEGLRKLQERRREEGETAFPEIGSILAAVAAAAGRRKAAASLATEQVLVRWRCPDCGIYKSGFISPTDHQPRTCSGIGRAGHSGERCGKIMAEVDRQETCTWKGDQ